MKNPLNKYKVGLSVIFVFTLGLAIYAAAQAGSARQDNETYKKATKIASELNNYTVSKPPPMSLEAAGISDVPKTVQYTKISNQKYKFCVTYKADSSGFDAGSIQTQLLTGGYGNSYSYPDSDYETSYLYISPIHKKGENCQTIKNYSGIYDRYDGYSSTSVCKYDVDASDKAYEEYLNCLDTESRNDSGEAQP